MTVPPRAQQQQQQMQQQPRSEQEKQRWMPMVFVLMAQIQCCVLWKMTVRARPDPFARHMLRTARPLLRQVQHCLPLALAARGSSSSSSGGSGDMSSSDTALHALELQSAVVDGVLAVKPELDSVACTEVALSDELATAALQQLLAACALLHKQAEQQQQQQLPPTYHASLQHLLPGVGDTYTAVLRAHATTGFQRPTTPEEEAEYSAL
jgi:hypothetical protein